MAVNILGLNNIIIGDYEVLKQVFSHPAVQNRTMQ